MSTQPTSTVPDAIAKGSMRSMGQPWIAVDDELALRPWAPADAPSVLAAFSDPDIVRWHTRRMDSLDQAEGWIEDQHDAWTGERSASFAIVRNAADSVLGRTALHTDLESGVAEIAYWLLPRGRGRGVVARAGRVATTWAHEFGFHRVELEHSTENEASCRTAHRLGFAAEGVKRRSNHHADGLHDMHLHAHLATDP